MGEELADALKSISEPYELRDDLAQATNTVEAFFEYADDRDIDLASLDDIESEEDAREQFDRRDLMVLAEFGRLVEAIQENEHKFNRDYDTVM